MEKNRLRFSGIIVLCLLLIAAVLPANALGATAPTAPTGLAALASGTSEIDLSWAPVDGAASYQIYILLPETTVYQKAATVTVPATTYTSTGLCANTTYSYKVRAYNSAGTSAYSSVVPAMTEVPEVIPGTPGGLKATATGSDTINLTWNAVTNAESYYVYRSTTSSGTYTQIKTVQRTDYSNTGLTAGKRYYYKVAAHNSLGTGPQSSYAYDTTDIDIPDIPANLDATAISSSQINLTWNSVSEATSYYVFRSTSSSGTYTKIATVTDELYNNTGLSANTTYYYKVQAHNTQGTSDYSTTAYATTKSTSTSGDASNTYRLAGTDRYATAANIAEDGWTTSYYAVIASGENFPDALCGSPLAAKYDAPILLTTRDQLNQQTRTQLLNLNVDEVFIIGGTGVISSSVEQAIRNLGITVTRLAGGNRYETSLVVAKKMGAFDQAIIVTGSNFPDALSIASIAGMKGYPIILTDRYSIQTDILSYIRNKASDTIVVGGTSVISDSVFNQLPSPTRLNGENRYVTNLNIIKYFAASLDFENCYAATGENFPDALSGSALAAMNTAPVFLVSKSLSLSLLNYMKDQDIVNITAFGSTSVIPSSVLNSLASSASGVTNILSMPTGLTAADVGPSEIYLDWDPVSDATGYYIYRATSSTDTYNKIETVQTSYYTDSGLNADTTYYYKVKAYNSYGASDYSLKAYDRTDADYVLDTPDPDAVALNSKEIQLSWDSVSGSTSYYVYRSTSFSGDYLKIKTVSTLGYKDTGLQAEDTYYYKIQAYSSSGLSDFSEVVYAKTDAVSIPDNLTATVLSSSQIKLTWDTVSDATSYYIYRLNSSGTYVKIASATVGSYTNTGLTAGTTYSYKIKVYNGSTTGDFSLAAEATTASI